jgi:hypothetical protein
VSWSDRSSDVSEALDAVGLAEHGAGLLVERACLVVGVARGVVVGPFERDVSEALDAVGLAAHVADLLVKRVCLVVGVASGVVVGPVERDVSEGLDAVGLAAHVADLLVERACLVVGVARGVVIGPRERHPAQPGEAVCEDLRVVAALGGFEQRDRDVRDVGPVERGGDEEAPGRIVCGTRSRPGQPRDQRGLDVRAVRRQRGEGLAAAGLPGSAPQSLGERDEVRRRTRPVLVSRRVGVGDVVADRGQRAHPLAFVDDEPAPAKDVGGRRSLARQERVGVIVADPVGQAPEHAEQPAGGVCHERAAPRRVDGHRDAEQAVVGGRAAQQAHALGPPAAGQVVEGTLAVGGMREQLDREWHATHLAEQLVEPLSVEVLRCDREEQAARGLAVEGRELDRSLPAHAGWPLGAAQRRDERHSRDRRERGEQLLDGQCVALPRRLEVVQRERARRQTQLREHARERLAGGWEVEDGRDPCGERRGVRRRVAAHEPPLVSESGQDGVVVQRREREVRLADPRRPVQQRGAWRLGDEPRGQLADEIVPTQRDRRRRQACGRRGGGRRSRLRGGPSAKVTQEPGQLVMAVAVRQRDRPLARTVLGSQLVDLRRQAQAVVAVLAAGERLFQPRAQRREVRIAGAVADADEQQRAHRRHRALQRLRRPGRGERGVRAHAEHDRGGVAPLPVQVHDDLLARRLQRVLDRRAVAPRHRVVAGRALDEVVVVRRGQRHPERDQRVGDRRVAQLERADRRAHPRRELTFVEGRAHDLRGHDEARRVRRVQQRPSRDAALRRRARQLLGPLDPRRDERTPRAQLMPSARGCAHAAAGDHHDPPLCDPLTKVVNQRSGHRWRL